MSYLLNDNTQQQVCLTCSMTTPHRMGEKCKKHTSFIELGNDFIYQQFPITEESFHNLIGCTLQKLVQDVCAGSIVWPKLNFTMQLPKFGIIDAILSHTDQPVESNNV